MVDRVLPNVFGLILILGPGLVPTMTAVKATPKSQRSFLALPIVPSQRTPLTGDETVDEVMTRHPGLRLAMMSYGLCTCCSGSLTLRQSAAARGIPLEVILADLQQELAKGA